MKNLTALTLIFGATIFACSKKEPALVELTAELYNVNAKPFYHGVASGDPLADRVILWTRVTPETQKQRINVTWEISEEPTFSSIYKSDTTSTTPAKDYTVKIDVDGLKPGRFYYYRFHALDKTSPTGRTKTTSIETDSVQFAIVSCSNWEFGYFNAYENIARRNVDAVIHLGDYIYEYQQGGYGDSTVNRKHLPAHEIITLKDYRTRYAQYHLDRGLQAVRQQHPFITIWDDHEVANNVYQSGAQNHQDNEGDFEKRKAAARQAYYEWLPIREGKHHYRSFAFGNMADLIMLDERLEGRTKPVDSLFASDFESEERTMLGAEQLQWLENSLSRSQALWKVIGNQVIFSEVDQSGPFPTQPRNLDSWDGYPAEQKKITNFIRNQSVKNVVFITGDTHASWAFSATENPLMHTGEKMKSPIAIELGAPSISSSNWNEYAPDDSVKKSEQILFKANPHLKYGNARDHGYLLLKLSASKATAEWWYVNTLRTQDNTEQLGKRMELLKGTNELQ